MARARRRWPWLLAAALLLALGGWVMFSTEPPLPKEPKQVRLPRRATSAESARNEERRVWTPSEPADGGARLSAPPRPRDPMLAAMPAEVKRVAVVVEANAIRNSELGDLMVDCFFAGDDRTLASLRDAGLDPLSQIDRVAIADDNLLMSGDFSHADFGKLGKISSRTSYGRNGELLEFERTEGEGLPVGLWRGQMLVMGRDEAGVKAALDRLDGSGPTQQPVLDESQAYGEVYGVVQGHALATLIGEGDPRLGQIIRDSAAKAELHVDVSHDVGLVADVKGNDPAKSEELRKSLGSALALAKLQAQVKKNADQEELLGMARVHSAEGGTDFRLEAGLPHDFLAKALHQCVEEKRARRALAIDAGAPQ